MKKPALSQSDHTLTLLVWNRLKELKKRPRKVFARSLFDFVEHYAHPKQRKRRIDSAKAD